MRRIKSFRRKSPAEVTLYCLVSCLFMVVALSYIYILVWTLFSAVKTHNEIVMTPFSLPTTWHWEHFLEVFNTLEVSDTNFFGMLKNSILFSVVPALLSQLVSMSFAYVCTKYTFPGNKWPFMIVLIMLTLPLYGSGGAVYKLYYNLGLINSYWQLIVAASGFDKAFLYYTAYFKTVSWSYAEAAMMDGANAFQIYYKVMFPMAKPLFTALFIIGWKVQWNSYSGGLVYYPKLPTLPMGIYQFNKEMIYRARLDILFSACLYVSIPALIIYIIFNKTMTTSVSFGGLKG